MNRIYGISVCNPVDIEREYLLQTVEYAKKQGVKHIQFIGPIHNPVKGNIDGMIKLNKYSRFNGEKDLEFVERTREYVNEACDCLDGTGIKSYVWHHELEVPAEFLNVYPEILNKNGDPEITHPLIKDYLINKIEDFFHQYPKIDGIILTLHETRVPLLKLKNQKLSPIERVKYVTELLYNKCVELGKELIVRPFASTDEDYDMMMKAYEEISGELEVMDKWTQFDWSLTLPNNKFYSKIKNNPLYVEADIFGEFFGKGRLPIMLENHIKEKFEYCEKFNPKGYVFRIDREGQHNFGEVNEVNLYIADALIKGKSTDTAIDSFFESRYGEAGREVKEIMKPTEDILKKIFYTKGYYFTELSSFPTLNHSKNHFYFEMMKEDCCIVSKEWFIPPSWERGEVSTILEEKKSAVDDANKLFIGLEKLKEKLTKTEYSSLYKKFLNLKLIAIAWLNITEIFMCYTNYFQTKDAAIKERFYALTDELMGLYEEGRTLLGSDFYCMKRAIYIETDENADLIPEFVSEVKKSFEIEENKYRKYEDKNITDFIAVGGAMEGHKLMKEVNFSDTVFINDDLCRIAGSNRGNNWSLVNAHGWFSYEIKVKKNIENKIKIVMGTFGDSIDVKITIEDKIIDFSKKTTEKYEFVFPYTTDKEFVRIRFDRVSSNTPCVYEIVVNDAE